MTGLRNVLILAGAILLAVVLYCYGTRYQIVPLNSNYGHNAYVINRITGESWFYHGYECLPIKNAHFEKSQ
jgi:hypothetical protein